MSCKKTVAFYTLGCKVNQYETESVKKQLMDLGYEEVHFDEKAHIYIVNSCTVTSIADRKTRNMLRRAKKNNPESIVIVTGCYAQTNATELNEISEIDYVIGNSDKTAIYKLVAFLDRENNTEDSELKEKLSDEMVLHHDIFKTDKYEELEFSTLREMTRAYIKIQDGCNNFCSYCKIPYARGKK